jgi:hypothetical protein
MVGRVSHALTRKEEDAVRKFASAAMGLVLAATSAVHGQDGLKPVEPGRLALQAGSDNQQLATAIAERLRHNASLKHYRVDIAVADSVAELTGQVADAAQRDEVVRTTHAVPGIERVHNRLTVIDSRGMQAVQATAPPIEPAPGGMPPPPLPIYSAHGGMPNGNVQQPPLPPNAWPTVAPYNNYSRVAYPTQYPYQSWPVIGPNYPFPKVPLGWRAVTLRWQDGYWWYGREASGHDWWRIRYW